MKANHSFLLFDGDGRTHREPERPLASAGYLVSHTTNLDTALRRLREKGDVELVLVDDRAPKALDFIRRVRREHRARPSSRFWPSPRSTARLVR